MAGKPLDGILVVALEQAVAAPWCSGRLADAGARVVKVEATGCAAHEGDRSVFGESATAVWVDRGKEWLALDLRSEPGRSQLHALLAGADVFIQNLAPGAAARLGFGTRALREAHPRLVTCDISGYGENGPLHLLEADDLLVQAESGLVAVSGAPGAWGRIGVPICDIAAGMNALIGVQQALLQRQRTGQGSSIRVSLFDSAAELMAVPYLQARYGDAEPQRVGLRHPAVAPCGAFTCSDGRDIVLCVREAHDWADFCKLVLGDPALARDPRFADNATRIAHRAELDALIQAVLGQLTSAQAADLLTEAHTAFGSVNSVHDLIGHPQLRTREMRVNGRSVQVPATPFATEWDEASFAPVTRTVEHRACPAAPAAPQARRA